METAAELTLRDEYCKILDFEKLKYCFECGICTGSCPMAELLPEIYNPRVLIQEAIDRLVSSREKPVFRLGGSDYSFFGFQPRKGKGLPPKLRRCKPSCRV